MTYTQVKNKIDLTITNNGVNAITGPMVNEVATDVLNYAKDSFETEVTDRDAAIAVAIDALKDGVPNDADTLLKLYNIVLAQSREITVADIAERNALDIEDLPTNVFVNNDGDGNWALYKATTTGVGATYVKISDPDLLNAVMSASAIKSSYESNANTNAYTDAEKTKLAGIAAGATVQVNSDWNATTGVTVILNKPTIPAAQVQTDWNATSGIAAIANLPTFGAVAFSNDYASLSNKPTIPSQGVMSVTGGVVDNTDPLNVIINAEPPIGYTPYNATNPSGYISGIDYSAVVTALAFTPENVSNKGVADGYVPLTSSTKIDTIYLPDSILGNVKYKGTYDFGSDLITSDDVDINGAHLMAADATNNGWYFIVTTDGTVNSIDFNVGDWLLSDGVAGWSKVDNTDAIASFNGRNGVIVLTSTDVTDALGYTPQTPLSNASASVSGILTSTDWNTFNGKQNALGNASASVSGILTAAHWSLFNAKQSALSNASASISGILTSTDWSTFNNKQDALVSTSNIKSINGASILGSGDLAVTAATPLSGLTAATGTNSINNGNHGQTWNWAMTGAAVTALKITENTAATGGAGSQYLVDIGTLAASTANPFRVSVRATDAILVDRTGIVTIGSSANTTSNTVATQIGNGSNATISFNTSNGTNSNRILISSTNEVQLTATGGNFISKAANNTTPVLSLGSPNNSTAIPTFISISNTFKGVYQNYNNGAIGSNLSLYAGTGLVQGHIVSLTGLGTNECLRLSATGGSTNNAIIITGGNVTMASTAGCNFIIDTTVGTKWGTAANQKQSFWGATPLVQPTTAIATSTLATNTSGIVNDSATWDGYTMGQVVKALRNIGILA